MIIQPKMLDPDQMNTDPKHWHKFTSLMKATFGPRREKIWILRTWRWLSKSSDISMPLSSSATSFLSSSGFSFPSVAVSSMSSFSIWSDTSLLPCPSPAKVQEYTLPVPKMIRYYMDNDTWILVHFFQCCGFGMFIIISAQGSEFFHPEYRI